MNFSPLRVDEPGMTQPISRPQHGIADYGFVPVAALAPTLFGFKDEPKAASLSRGMAATALLTSLATRAEWGAVKKLPYRGHLALDVVSGVAAIAAPWVLGFANNRRARNAFLGFGAFALAVTALSRPEEM